MNAPCAFGCTSLGASGFSCGCPQGYQRIGQGHCLSTISPSGGYGQDIGNVPTYQITDHVKSSDDKLISTEGCFSCKVFPPNYNVTLHLFVFWFLRLMEDIEGILNIDWLPIPKRITQTSFITCSGEHLVDLED